MTTNRRNVWPLLKACFVVRIGIMFELQTDTFCHRTQHHIPNTKFKWPACKDQRENNEKKLLRHPFFGKRTSILNENLAVNNIFVHLFLFENICNFRLISNFQNPNIHGTQNTNFEKARPTLLYSSGFHCRPRQNLFWF